MNTKMKQIVGNMKAVMIAAAMALGAMGGGRAGDRIFGIIHTNMNSLSLQIALLRRLVYAGDGMGSVLYCAMEVA